MTNDFNNMIPDEELADMAGGDEQLKDAHRIGTLFIRAGGVPIREMPDKNSKVVSTVGHTTVHVYEINQNQGFIWYHISQGWIANQTGLSYVHNF